MTVGVKGSLLADASFSPGDAVAVLNDLSTESVEPARSWHVVAGTALP
jgi:hypothetical protein